MQCVNADIIHERQCFSEIVTLVVVISATIEIAQEPRVQGILAAVYSLSLCLWCSILLVYFDAEVHYLDTSRVFKQIIQR